MSVLGKQRFILMLALEGCRRTTEIQLTNIGGGINAGQNCFALSSFRPFAAKVMIVLTDGIDTVGQSMSFQSETCLLTERGPMQQVNAITGPRPTPPPPPSPMGDDVAEASPPPPPPPPPIDGL
ncbi:MAG TPA: hypothetical protein VM260_26385 [Pirellula sp.]|nr:hypothetical protein [Pirellula sp.]